MTSIPDERLYEHSDRVKNKVVVITGGANGIGREAALIFAHHGANIVIGDQDAEGGASLVRELQDAGRSAISLKCDVTNWDDQVALFELAMSKFGAVDIVIPNAGVNETMPFDQVKLEKGRPVKPRFLTIDVNLQGVLYTTHLALHYLQVNRIPRSLKAIVLLGSIASWQAIPKAPLYTASKHGVLGLMRSLHPVIAVNDIRIGCIHPFFADTNIVPLPIKLFLAGIPKTPVARIAGAIFYAATEPSPESSGNVWILPDDGPVLQLAREELKMGVYEMIDKRAKAAIEGLKRINYYANVAHDVWKILGRQLVVLGAGVLAAKLAFSNREQLIALLNWP